MKILLITQSYPPVLGGLQTVVSQLAEGLAKKGHHVLVITNKYPMGLPSWEMQSGFELRRLFFMVPEWRQLKNGRLDLFFAGILLYPLTIIQLSNFIRKFAPDVINIHYPLDVLPFLWTIPKKMSVKVIFSFHGGEVKTFKQRADGFGKFGELIRSSGATTACSTWLLNEVKQVLKTTPKQLNVIHNAVLVERFKDKNRYVHTRSYIFAYGRLTKQKGFDILIQAFGSSKLPGMGIDLLIAGDGEDKLVLLELIDSLDMAEKIIMVGRATSEEVVTYLNGCEMVIIPSRWEPFGIVALEALAAGKRSVCSRIGGLPEVYAEYPRMTRFAEPTVEGIKEALNIMTLEPLIEKTPEVDLSKFSIDRLIAEYEMVYKQVLGNF